TVAGSWLAGRTRLGFALRAIGEDETVARHTRIDTTLVKALGFALTACRLATVPRVQQHERHPRRRKVPSVSPATVAAQRDESATLRRTPGATDATAFPGSPSRTGPPGIPHRPRSAQSPATRRSL